MAAMATMCFAMWLQAEDLATTNRLIMIFIGMVAAAMIVMAVVQIGMSLTARKAIKELKASAEDFKARLLPLIEVATEVAESSRDLLDETTPKVKVITDNLVRTSETLKETSQMARSAVQQCDATLADVNWRTRRQVARVDGMITATLTTAAEVVETVAVGIRGPAQKLAVAATQGWLMVEGLVAKIKSKAPRSSFGGRG